MLRSRKAGAADRLKELRALRASGKTRLDSYQVEEAQDLYDEVDDQGYKDVVRNRLDQDDFVADDDGQGYADDGREDWHNEQQAQYDSESEQELPTRGKNAKRKRDEDREHEERTNNTIKGYFNANPAALQQKPKHIVTADDTAFMEDLLGEVNVNVASRRPAMKPVRNESRRKTRVLSPPVEATKRPLPKHKPAKELTASLPSPAPEPSYDDDEPMMPSVGDEAPMSDPPAPSSPVASAVERKGQSAAKALELEDDDMMEVAQSVGHHGLATKSVNIAASRPAPKVKQTDYPTPVSSSPTTAPAEVVDPSSWNAVTSKLNVLSSPATDAPAVGKLQPQEACEADGSLRFFWTDYTELNGSLLLFGKVKNKTNGQYVSCFVKVDNILRKLYFLPRTHRHKGGRETGEEVDMGSVYEEVDALMSKMKVGMHKIKPCERKYAFELPDVPREAEYLKLLYPYDKPALSADLKGETFAQVFGTNTSLFEQFVLWKHIMGPCWLKIEDADFVHATNASWCKLEVQVGKPNSITTLGDTDNLDAPPLTLMSIALRTTMNMKDNKQEILMASARIYENVSLSDTTPAEKLPCKTITILRPTYDGGFPAGFKSDIESHRGNIKLVKGEQELLSLFLANLHRVDPDVLMGHRLEDLDYSILLSRLRDRKTPGWHKIGRLRRSQWPSSIGKGGSSFFVERQLIAGRLLCDLANDMGKSMMTKCQSWSLNEMCELVLGQGNVRRDIDNEVALQTWAKSREGLMNYVKHCEADTHFIAAIALKTQMLPLTKVLTNLAGNSWARTLTGTRAERNEYILLHEFHRNKYICPDKIHGKGKPKEEEPAEDDDNVDKKKKDKYKGGLVFEPEKGLYDKVVLVMDFNSLYPSIIQEYNICFTTVDRSSFSEEDEKVPDVPEEQKQGVLPRLIATLVNRRREVKKLMKDKSASPDQLATWDIKQLALKLTANSMYGCLGYTKSRFYARPLAMLTTFKGRDILRNTKELAEGKQLQVIYGDTDSVMINTNVDNIQEALKIGNEFKRAVNERYRLLEIDIDNTFRRLLLHAKKKYAAINMVEVDGKFVDKMEVKGLDMRRREYCALSKDTSSKLLNLLLSGEDPETVISKIHDHLRTLSASMREQSIPAAKYIIYTQLSKAPQDYPNAKSMPSVQVALRLLGKGKPVRAKDVMSFIITGANGGSSEEAAKNAYPPDDVLKSGSELKPDIDYYLHKQILPPVERLCAPISLTNVTRLAECLGLDTSKYRVSNAAGASNADGPQDNTIRPLESQIPDHVRFADCEALRFRCLAPACRAKPASELSMFTFRSLTEDASSEASVISHSGLTCPGCKTTLPNLSAVCQLEHQIRQLLAQYYEGWLVCDDPSCGNRTRSMSVYGHRCLGPRGLGRGCLGRMQWEFSEKKLWNQLCCWERAFDVEKVGKGVGSVKEEELPEKVKVLRELNRERFGTLKGVVKAYLDKCGRQWVDMGGLFKFVQV